MRCDEVVQEISAPSGRLDHQAMAAHLAACSCCAAWSEKMEKLDRLWEATRPAEPSTDAFDRVWANVNQTITSATSEAAIAQNGQPVSTRATVLTFEPKRTGLIPWPWMAGLMAPLAVAAALWLILFDPTQKADTPHDIAQISQLEDQGAAEIALSSIDLDQGGVPIIHIGEGGPPRIEERPLTPVSDTETIAASFDMFNYVETLSDFQGAL